MNASNSNADTPREEPDRSSLTTLPLPAATVMEEGDSPLNPSDRAFWFGFGVVLLSMTSALASYLILTGLTSIAPRNEYVWTALAVNVVLILAMLGTILWQPPLTGRVSPSQ